MKDTALKLLAEGMAAVQVAEQLGVPAATVRSWKRRADAMPGVKPKAKKNRQICQPAETADFCDAPKKAKVSRAKFEPGGPSVVVEPPPIHNLPRERDSEVLQWFAALESPEPPTSTTVTPEPARDTTPNGGGDEPTRRHWRAVLLDVVLLLIIGGHSLLVWFDCATQWGNPGFIGGGVTFLIVVASVLLATDRNQYNTSEVASWFVLLIDVGAWFVHVPTFMRESSIGKTETQVFSWFLVGCAWFALYLFRSSKNN